MLKMIENSSSRSNYVRCSAVGALCISLALSCHHLGLLPGFLSEKDDAEFCNRGWCVEKFLSITQTCWVFELYAKVKALEIATSQQTDLATIQEIQFLQCSCTISTHLLTNCFY
jgi:hypothetical protein